jgi:uncharacterized protein (DUF433 family)
LLSTLGNEAVRLASTPPASLCRITVYDVLHYLASGMSQQEILDDFPDLTETGILACLSYAADAERSFEVVTI